MRERDVWSSIGHRERGRGREGERTHVVHDEEHGDAESDSGDCAGLLHVVVRQVQPGSDGAQADQEAKELPCVCVCVRARACVCVCVRM